MKEIAQEIHETRKSEMRVRDVTEAIKTKLGICAYHSKVSKLLKNELGLSYRRTRLVNIHANAEKNLLLRQWSCMKIIH